MIKAIALDSGRLCRHALRIGRRASETITCAIVSAARRRITSRIIRDSLREGGSDSEKVLRVYDDDDDDAPFTHSRVLLNPGERRTFRRADSRGSAFVNFLTCCAISVIFVTGSIAVIRDTRETLGSISGHSPTK